uniref:MYND-type domain-containing protein n=1 Tax=Junco hyemalis TaxID=40217 RepID=A0A8C5JTR0_JUNHY
MIPRGRGRLHRRPVLMGSWVYPSRVPGSLYPPRPGCSWLELKVLAASEDMSLTFVAAGWLLLTLCRSAMDGRKSGSDFGIRTYFDMFQKMEDTFKFCVECKKLPDALPDPKSLRRCKRCQNVYYCGVACQRANWPLHKKFCKKLKLVALDRLVEWLIFTAAGIHPAPGHRLPLAAAHHWPGTAALWH